MSDVPALHRMAPEIAKRLSDADLHWVPAIQTNDSVEISIIAAELRQRESRTTRQAVWVAIAAIIISIIALFRVDSRGMPRMISAMLSYKV